MAKLQRALISVYDKDKLEVLLPVLKSLNAEIISSGGTARKIASMGYDVIEVGAYTGFPESPDGLVKTLQPKIHGGILLDPANSVHTDWMDKQKVPHIDLVVANLYPFEDTIAKEGVTPAEAFEQIDIGGPTMVRSSAKAALLHGSTTVVVDPDDYEGIAAELKAKGEIGAATTKKLALKAFKHTKEYDTAIVAYLEKL